MDLIDRTAEPTGAALPPPLIAAGDLLKGVLEEIATRHQTRCGGGWTGGLRCGFSLIDQELRGLRPGSTTMLNAEPTVGKTTLVNQIAYQAAAFAGQSATAVYVTFEHDPAHLLLKQLARLSGWRMRDLEDGSVPATDPRLVEAAERLGATRLYYLRGNSVTTAEVLIARVAQAQQHKGAASVLLCLDYLQYFARYANARTAMDQVGMALVALDQVKSASGAALLVIGSQNRETNRGGSPTLYGGRTSGEIEYDADNLFTLTKVDAERRKLTLLKARFGENDISQDLNFIRDRALFEEAED